MFIIAMKRVLCVFDASFLFVSSIEYLGLCINEPRERVSNRSGHKLENHSKVEGGFLYHPA